MVEEGLWRGRPVRNANVLYELGIAHASRLAEEVLVVRGDSDALDFDIAGVRVRQYPKAAGVARDFVGTLVMNALSAVDQRRQIAVQRAVKTLDPVMYMLLEEFAHVEYPVVRTMRDVLVAQERLGAIRRLLDEGMFEAKYGPLPDDFVTRSDDGVRERPDRASGHRSDQHKRDKT